MRLPGGNITYRKETTYDPVTGEAYTNTINYEFWHLIAGAVVGIGFNMHLMLLEI
jgi:hypothetical protein